MVIELAKATTFNEPHSPIRSHHARGHAVPALAGVQRLGNACVRIRLIVRVDHRHRDRQRWLGLDRQAINMEHLLRPRDRASDSVQPPETHADDGVRQGLQSLKG